jgi:hypothetical protein
MTQRSYASPDGKWVVLAELTGYGNWGPCRVTPMGGSSQGSPVGPPKADCTSAIWSPDGKWIYLTSKAGGLFHLWRQRFPDGQPEQFTSGLTEEEGIAMAPDGRSIVTAVGCRALPYGFMTRGASGRFRYSKVTPPTRSSRRTVRSFATDCKGSSEVGRNQQRSRRSMGGGRGLRPFRASRPRLPAA